LKPRSNEPPEITATITGDYSKFPPAIRGVFPNLAGETSELRQAWAVYSHLFMEKKELTDAMGERLGIVIGMFQSMLQDEMFLSIARLTDKNSLGQTNLSLWGLLAAIPNAGHASFGQDVTTALEKIFAAAARIRKHRHKRIAHCDLKVALRSAILPVVTFEEIRAVLEQIEEFLNLFHWEFEGMTMQGDKPSWFFRLVSFCIFPNLYLPALAGTKEQFHETSFSQWYLDSLYFNLLSGYYAFWLQSKARRVKKYVRIEPGAGFFKKPLWLVQLTTNVHRASCHGRRCLPGAPAKSNPCGPG